MGSERCIRGRICIVGGNNLVFAEEPGIQVPKRLPKATQKALQVNLGVARSKEAPKVGSGAVSGYPFTYQNL